MSWILGIRRRGRNMKITREQIAEAYKRLDILTAQIGNARIRKMHKDPLKQFIKAVEKELTK
jgi:ABC-type Fe3+-citrate transport system substrate-binding protein